MKFFIALIIFSMSQIATASCQDLKDLRFKMNTISFNLANATTTRTPKGGAYQRREVVDCKNGCQIIKKEEFISRYEPGHPDADQNGYVSYPDINLQKEISEMVRLSGLYDQTLLSCKK